MRTQGDIRLDSGVPRSWLRGRSPVLPRSKFIAKWQGDGGLYAVDPGGDLHVSLEGLAGH